MRIWRHLFSTPRRWRANELFLPAGNYAVGRLFPFPDTPFRGLWDAVSWSLIRRLAGACTTYRVFDFWTALVFPRWEIFLPSMGMFDSQGGNSFCSDFACRTIRQRYWTTEAGYWTIRAGYWKIPHLSRLSFKKSLFMDILVYNIRHLSYPGKSFSDVPNSDCNFTFVR